MIHHRTFFIIPVALAALAAIAFGPTVRAAGLTVTPAIIDDHGVPRDIFNYSVTVTNTEARVMNVFATVHNLTADGKQEFVDTSSADRTVSLANWMSVSRASMMLQPGESKTIPVGIQISPYATAGKYHAVIAFVEGSTRDAAEAHIDGAPQVIVNLDVRSNAKEEMEASGFGPVKRFSSKFPVDFSFTLKNLGTVSSTPEGSVYFYDRVGHEVGSVNANPEKIAVAPGEGHAFSVRWEDGGGYGQYKAMLELTYGARGAKIEEVALLWVMPWLKLLVAFTLLFALVLGAALFFYRRYEIRHHRRMGMIRHLLSRKQVLDLRHPHDINRHG